MSGQLKIFYILNNNYPLYQKNVDVRDLHLSNYRRFGSAIYILYIQYSSSAPFVGASAHTTAVLFIFTASCSSIVIL
jgi:hypothetical protein